MFSLPMIAYVLTVVLVNVGFSYVPLIPTAIGVFSPMAVVVGAIFVLRDFAQRRAGHGVLVAMVIATLFSYILADPYVATASALAFASSEVVDYLIYTFTKRPFRERVLISSLVSAPVDTAVFLFGIGVLETGTFVLMVLSKFVAAGVVWIRYKSGPEDEPAVDSQGVQIAR